MKDFRGNDIEVGDIVVYANRRGSILTLKEADVLSVSAIALMVKVVGGRRTVLAHPEYIVRL